MSNMTDAERDMVQRDAENDGNWALGLEDSTTEYTVRVTLEADMPTVPKTFATWREAEAHAQFVTVLLSGTAEPQPAHATHDAQGSTYTTSGEHELYGEWSVDLIVRDV